MAMLPESFSVRSNYEGTTMKDRAYWQRRTAHNTQPLASGDLKLLLSSIFAALDAVEDQLDIINEKIQSMGSKRSRTNGKKLEAGSETEGDASGDS